MSIGENIARIDGLAKLSGEAEYVDDLVVGGVWHGGTIRTPIARGRIRRVRFDPAVDWSEFTIVDHRDIPGHNAVKLIESDQPALAVNEFRHKHEPVVLLAHRSIRKLREGLKSVALEIEPLPTVLDPRQPLNAALVQYGDDNTFKRIDIDKGNPQSVFDRAVHVVEGEYVTGSQEHVYLETQGMVAHLENGQIVVKGSMQCPYYVLDSLTHLFGRSREAFRVVQTPVGGGFGGKEDYPSMIAIHAALLAEKSGAAVKMVYDRQEDMAVTTKRHPSRVRHRTAVDRDGRLLAMEIDVLLDGGAYITLSPVVLSRACIHAAGPYYCENIRIHGEVKLTNSPPYGAFRGFGAPQTLFALERHMNEIALRLGLDPAELRRRNLIREGQTLATGQVVRDRTDLVALMDRALH
ncbi:MAG: xanthine dehydrogenase family protein, partial [Planctomycetota bacterium]